MCVGARGERETNSGPGMARFYAHDDASVERSGSCAIQTKAPPKRGRCWRGISLQLAAGETESSEAEAEQRKRGGFGYGGADNRSASDLPVKKPRRAVGGNAAALEGR